MPVTGASPGQNETSIVTSGVPRSGGESTTLPGGTPPPETGPASEGSAPPASPLSSFARSGRSPTIAPASPAASKVVEAGPSTTTGGADAHAAQSKTMTMAFRDTGPLGSP